MIVSEKITTLRNTLIFMYIETFIFKVLKITFYFHAVVAFNPQIDETKSINKKALQQLNISKKYLKTFLFAQLHLLVIFYEFLLDFP